MPRDGWKSISLPKELLNRIENFINNCPEEGYTNSTELIKDSIRRHLDYLIDRKLREKL